MIEEATYAYKKHQNKGAAECLVFILGRLVRLILEYDEKTIEFECGLPKERRRKFSVKLKKNPSPAAVVRGRSSSLLRPKGLSLEKLSEK